MKTQRERSLITKYWLLGGGGAMLLGSGLAVLLEGAKLREQKAKPWFWISTGGYALIMSGLSLIGDANRFRTLADVLKELKDRTDT
ncbi:MULTISPECIES: hypothetical protein [unclassified Spirosoma]|uniref:hypothetical protein n=1 Tax=unclassified Spirosoma TaxID=2621999 RepID=UPI00096561EF|nr:MULTISPECIES: hypothetical protein [unclassified Spirosoma]MBN8821170.1 hypothetical protein [Spirosoma sp.]OJW79199.1 MAG: hypothetical protein BGO59_11675 [Spirosoma sp. 48-14]